MGSIDKLQQLKKKEAEIESIFEELKNEKRKEAIEQISQLLRKGETDQAREMIERMENLDSVKWQRNDHVLNRMAEMFDMKMEDLDVDYEQLKTNHEIAENKNEILQIFTDQLKNRGFHVEGRKEDVWQLRKDGEALFFFEIEKGADPIKEIEARQKYSSILIGVKTLQDEHDTEIKINEWLSGMPEAKKETMKKYLKFNITSKQRLTEEAETHKRLKVA